MSRQPGDAYLGPIRPDLYGRLLVGALPAMPLLSRESLGGGLVLTSVAALVLVGVCGGAPPASPGAEITLQVVKYDQLQKELAAHKGRVVLVDVWSTT